MMEIVAILSASSNPTTLFEKKLKVSLILFTDFSRRQFYRYLGSGQDFDEENRVVASCKTTYQCEDQGPVGVNYRDCTFLSHVLR